MNKWYIFLSNESFRFNLVVHFIRPSNTGHIMSWPPSVRPLTFRVRSVTDTIQVFFMKYKCKSSWTMCREEEPKLHLHVYGIMSLLYFYKNRVRSMILIPSRIFS